MKSYCQLRRAHWFIHLSIWLIRTGNFVHWNSCFQFICVEFYRIFLIKLFSIKFFLCLRQSYVHFRIRSLAFACPSVRPLLVRQMCGLIHFKRAHTRFPSVRLHCMSEWQSEILLEHKWNATYFSMALLCNVSSGKIPVMCSLKQGENHLSNTNTAIFELNSKFWS